MFFWAFNTNSILGRHPSAPVIGDFSACWHLNGQSFFLNSMRALSIHAISTVLDKHGMVERKRETVNFFLGRFLHRKIHRKIGALLSDTHTHTHTHTENWGPCVFQALLSLSWKKKSRGLSIAFCQPPKFAKFGTGRKKGVPLFLPKEI